MNDSRDVSIADPTGDGAFFGPGREDQVMHILRAAARHWPAQGIR
jgi:hypothetical protein